jgi:hypothetical protein
MGFAFLQRFQTAGNDQLYATNWPGSRSGRGLGSALQPAHLQ